MNSEAEQQLQHALLTTYHANLLFLCEYNNELYKRVDVLSNEINQGRYKEIFLDFIQENGDFDIFDSKTDTYLYKKKPKKYNDLIVNNFTLNSKESIFTLNKKIYEKIEIEENDYKNIKIDSALDSMKYLVNEVQEYAEVLDDNLSSLESKKYKEIEKIIFLGTLLSRHILSIVKKYKPKHFFICEENLEIFRLSLFVFDYTLLVENGGTAVFSIMEDETTFNKKFKLFYRNNSLYNALLKYCNTGYNTEHYFERIFNTIVESNPIAFNYIHTLYCEVKLTFERIENYKTLILSSKEDTYLSSKKVLFIGAGPSLDEYINWIKEHQDSYIIVAMGASYKKLIDNSIKVDILTTIDSTIDIFDRQFSDDTYIEKLKDTIIIASYMTHEKVIEKLDKKNIYMFLFDNPFFLNNSCPGGFSVGEITCDILLSLGARKINLIGLDFSINQKTGSTHTINSSSKTNSYDISETKSSLEKLTFDLNSDLIKVKGNYLDEVFTTRKLHMSALALSSILRKYENYEIYNFSKNAVKVDGIDYKETESERLNTLDKNYSIKLNDFFDDNSRISLDEDERARLEEEKNYFKVELSKFKMLKKFDINSFKSFEDTYIKSYNELFKNEFASKFSTLIFRRYYDTVFTYIYYHFNGRKIKDEKAKIEKITIILSQQIERMIIDYINYLNKVLNR